MGEGRCAVLWFTGWAGIGASLTGRRREEWAGLLPLVVMLASGCFPESHGQGDGTGDFSVSSASPPQGELNGQRGLVPSNFLEGPGPEAGGLESGMCQAESQVSEELSYQISILSLSCWCAGAGIVWKRVSEA